MAQSVAQCGTMQNLIHLTGSQPFHFKWWFQTVLTPNRMQSSFPFWSRMRGLDDKLGQASLPGMAIASLCGVGLHASFFWVAVGSTGG